MDAEVARQVIQRRLQVGRLPHGRVLALPVCRGGGEMCDGCGEPMTRNQKMLWGIAVRDWVSIQFHADCFQIWEVERLLPMNETRFDPAGRHD